MDEKILLSSFTVKPETQPIDKFFRNDFFPSSFDSYSQQHLFKIMSVSPIIEDIEIYKSLYKNESSGHLSSFHEPIGKYKRLP